MEPLNTKGFSPMVYSMNCCCFVLKMLSMVQQIAPPPQKKRIKAYYHSIYAYSYFLGYILNLLHSLVLFYSPNLI